MNLICCKNRKKVETHQSPIIHPKVGYIKYLDSVIQEKSFDVTEITEYGYFGGTVILKQNETRGNVKVRIVREGYLGEKESEWRSLKHLNILPLLKMEYLQKNDSYLFYSPLEETTLQKKVEEKEFRKDPEALLKMITWLKEIADAVQYLHSIGYAHLNIQANSMIITEANVLQIADFHYVNLTNSRTDR